MHVFYDPVTFAIQYTASGENELVYGKTNWITVPDQNLGELQAWSVIDGALVLTNMVPVRDAAKVAMQNWINTFLSNVTGPIPIDEKLAWTAKAEAARRVLAGLGLPEHLAILEPEAALRGITVAVLADRIMIKSNLYTAVVSRVAGLRDVTWEAIKIATSPAQVQAILAGAKAQANALAAQLGI